MDRVKMPINALIIINDFSLYWFSTVLLSTVWVIAHSQSINYYSAAAKVHFTCLFMLFLQVFNGT